jgi:hypothetical protein
MATVTQNITSRKKQNKSEYASRALSCTGRVGSVCERALRVVKSSIFNNLINREGAVIMKSKVVNSIDKIDDFPSVRIAVDSKLTVLFSENKVGTVIVCSDTDLSSGFDLAFHSSSWDMEGFVFLPKDKAVKISN